MEKTFDAILSKMAQVQISQTENGLSFTLPGQEGWALNDESAVALSDLPEAFARSYLKINLRDFLYEAFCSAHDGSAEAGSAEADNAVPALANDRASGGLHAGLLKQFQQCNRGQGYLDPGWRVLSHDQDETLSVEKFGVVLSVERSRHLLPEHQRLLRQTREEHSSEQYVPIKLPGYRFEPGYYIAIGDCGPVAEAATEIYFAAAATAIPTLMETLTTALNGMLIMPYTLRAPYEPESYRGPEAIALRIEKTAIARIKPLLKRIREQHTTDEIRAESSLFGDTVELGISVADVIESSSTHWFGSSADLSRIELVAAALTESFHAAENLRFPEKIAPSSASSPSESSLSLIKQKLADSGICWEQPYLSQSLAS